MSEYIGVAILLAVLLCASLIVFFVFRARRHRSGPVEVSVEDPPEPPQLPDITEIPVENQPVTPADQAQGLGWMKASDLARQRTQP